jgi:D-3-phosphoglycerate dehydrogenase / 2-oxoglutarate reductase
MVKKWRVVNVEPMDKTGETYRLMEEAGCELILGRDGWNHPGDVYTEDELINLCRGADAIIAHSRDRYPRRLIESIPNLRVISKHGTGVDKIDVPAATECGVLVTNTPVHSPIVAEHTLGLMLAGMKRVVEATLLVRGGGWRESDLESMLVRGKTIGIVGFGRIGSEMAKRLQGWGVRILSYDPYASPEAMKEWGVIRCSTLEELLDQSDVVSLNAVLTNETRHMVGEEQLRRLKKTAFLINTSRGEILDEKALIKALKEGWIAGAALDVFEQEPPDPTSELFRLDNVILTPHMASFVPGINDLLMRTAMENALATLKGEVPRYIKNPEVIERWRARFGKGSR